MEEKIINEEDLKFTIKDNDGNDVICEMMASYTDPENNKAYIAYTDYIYDDDGNFGIFFSELIKDGEGNITLGEIDDEEIIRLLKALVSKAAEDEE